MISKPILVTGATGYVGGRLVPRLLDAGYAVRAMGRSLEKMACRPWGHHPRVTLVQGNVLNPADLKTAAAGCGVAYYLVHSMVAQKKRYADADRSGARNMVAAAAEGGLERIIYLGGLGSLTDPRISRHLRSRHEVGEVLASGPVPVTVLRAAMILGSGSASFEILRYLTERLPVMITPRWVFTPSQPIAIRNVLDYLQGCLEHPETAGETYDIGGPDVLNYSQLVQIFAEEAGLRRRLIIPVPVLTPGLSARWIHLVTPVPAAIAQPLTEGLSVPTVCEDHRIRDIVPLDLIGCRAAIRLALERVRQEMVETCWSDAGSLHPPEWAACGDAHYAGGTILECGYRVRLRASAAEVWRPVSRIGGDTGWYFGKPLWHLRGLMDRLAGGIGLRRGRRHASDLRVGDALDFWRVLEVQPRQRLLLLAEMKLPGEALFVIRLTPGGEGAGWLQFLSRFMPRGIVGILYWYTLYPFHQWVFNGMLKSIAAAVKRPLISGPERFTPKLQAACRLPSGKPPGRRP